MKLFSPTDAYSAAAMLEKTEAAQEMSGDALCRTLVKFLEDQYRGLIVIRLAGATGGRYKVRPASVATRVCHLIETHIDACPLTGRLGATTDTMCMSIEPSSSVHLAVHTVRRLRMQALQAGVELETESTAVRIDFPACPTTYALRHPTEDAERRLLSYLKHAATGLDTGKMDAHAPKE